MVKFIDKILDRPIVSTVGFLVLDLVVISIFVNIFKSIFDFLIPSFGSNLISSLSSIIVALIFLVIYKWYMRDKLQNLLSLKNFKFALILLIPSLIFIIGNLVSNYIDGNFTFNALIIVLGLGPGISEEIVFRGFILSNLMRIRKNKNLSIYWIACLSAIPFGFVHLFNIAVGANVNYSLAQMFFTICLGFLFAGVYLRTGNLIVPIISHSLIDITGLCNVESLNSSIAGLISQAPGFYDYVFMISGSLIALAFGLYYIRKEKWADIDKSWEDIVIE